MIGNYATMLQRPGITEEERQEYAPFPSPSRRLAQPITNIEAEQAGKSADLPQTQEFDPGEQLCERLLQFEDARERKP